MEKISLNSKGMLLFSLIWGFFLCGIFDGSSYSTSINSSDTTGSCEVLTLNLILLEDDLKQVKGYVLCGEGGYILKKKKNHGVIGIRDRGADGLNLRGPQNQACFTQIVALLTNPIAANLIICSLVFMLCFLQSSFSQFQSVTV